MFRQTLIGGVVALGIAAVSPSIAAPAAAETAAADCANLATCLRDLDTLMSSANEAREAQDFELEYLALTLLHRWHPESGEAEASFERAAFLSRLLYRVGGQQFPGLSPWNTADRQYMFYWLETRFPSGSELSSDAFPREDANRVLSELPEPHWIEFLEYAKRRHRLARWIFEAEIDNGRVKRVSGRLRPLPRPSGSRTGSPPLAPSSPQSP